MVTDKTFVKKYVAAFKNDGTAKDVAKATNMKLTQVYSRAQQMRDRGVKLPTLKMASPANHSTPAELNALIEQEL